MDIYIYDTSRLRVNVRRPGSMVRVFLHFLDRLLISDAKNIGTNGISDDVGYFCEVQSRSEQMNEAL